MLQANRNLTTFQSSMPFSNFPQIDCSLKLLKFTDDSCGLCYKMAHFDSVVANKMSIDMVEIKTSSKEFEHYRELFYSFFQDSEVAGWPTYILVRINGEKGMPLGVIKGALPKKEFREGLASFLSENQLE